MDLTILTALMFCWAGGMVMGAVVVYGIMRQRDPKPDLTVKAERITVDPEGCEQLQQDDMELITKQTAIDMIDEISIEVDEGYGFQYAKWRRFVCDLHGLNIGGWNDSDRR